MFTVAIVPTSRVPAIVVMGTRNPDFPDAAAEARWLAAQLHADSLIVDGAGRVVAKDTAWSLSPAYDLTPNPMIALERRDLAMAFGDWGRYANRTNLLSQCERFLVSKEEAARIVDGMIETINSSWYATARQAGVSERDCELIRGAFVYEGFGYDLTDQKIATDHAEGSA